MNNFASLLVAALAVPFAACMADDAPLAIDEPAMLAAPAADMAPAPAAELPAAAARIQHVDVQCRDSDDRALITFTSRSKVQLAELDLVPVLTPPDSGNGPWYTAREVDIFPTCARSLGNPADGYLCWLSRPRTGTCADFRAQLDKLDVRFTTGTETYDLRQPEAAATAE
jgi:hypothetical protein